MQRRCTYWLWQFNQFRVAQVNRTNGEAIPVIAHGLVRYWGKIDDSYTLSPLVVNQGNGQVNGVLLEVNEEALAEFDRRERGYHRIQIQPDQIETDANFNQGHEIWVYVKTSHYHRAQTAQSCKAMLIPC